MPATKRGRVPVLRHARILLGGDARLERGRDGREVHLEALVFVGLEVEDLRVVALHAEGGGRLRRVPG
jgi:hypothetical protein